MEHSVWTTQESQQARLSLLDRSIESATKELALMKNRASNLAATLVELEAEILKQSLRIQKLISLSEKVRKENRYGTDSTGNTAGLGDTSS